MTAVCVRCGQERADWNQICPHCGHRPEGEGLLVAWLLSSESLDDKQLQAVGERIRNGEVIRPSAARLERARIALGQSMASDPGLTVAQRVGMLATSLLATPLVGLTCWLWWRRTRPRAALQSLALSLPATILFTVMWPLMFLYAAWGAGAAG